MWVISHTFESDDVYDRYVDWIQEIYQRVKSNPSDFSDDELKNMEKQLEKAKIKHDRIFKSATILTNDYGDQKYV